MFVVSSNSMKKKIHGAQTCYIGDEIDSAKCPRSKVSNFASTRCPGFEIFKNREEESACAACWISYSHHGFRPHDFDNCTNDWTGCEILSCSASDVISVSG